MASILDFMGSGLTSPEQLLALRAHNDAEQGAAAAGPPPVNWDRLQLPPMPDSEQGPRGPGQGAAMAPAALPAAAPASVPAAPQGAQGAMAPTQDPPSKGFNIGDLLQGGGSIGQDTSHDSEIDPDYGISRGAIRRANNRSMFNSGLLLLAAGAARDDSSRASILSNLPGTMDNSNQLQNFARTRLEVAKSKIAIAQAGQAQAQDAAWQKTLGDMAARLGGPSAGAPAAAGAVPGPIQPLASATAASGALATAAGPANAPAVASAPATPTQDAPTSGTVPPAAPAASAQVALPAPGMTFPSAPASKLDRPAALSAWQPQSMADLNILKSMTREDAAKYIERRTTDLQSQVYAGAPYLDPTTKILMEPNYKNGQYLNSKPLGQEATNTRIVQDAQGNYRSQKVRPDGTISDDGFVTPHSQTQGDQLTAKDADLAAKNGEALKTQYGSLKNSGQDYARTVQAIADIDAGKVDSGPASGMMNYGRALFSNTVGLSDDEKQKLLASTNVSSLSNSIIGKLAKANNGSQVTDADVKFAANIFAGGGTPAEIKEALKRRAQDIRNDVQAYNDNADAHNSALDGVELGKYGKAQLRAKRVDGDFGTLGDATTPAYATPASGTAQAPNAPSAPAPAALSPRDRLRAAMSTDAASAPVPALAASPAVSGPSAPAAPASAVPSAAAAYLKANPALRGDFDRKYGAGAAASILGK